MNTNTTSSNYDLTSAIPVWTWNGYNSQWVYSLDSRDAVFQETIVEMDKPRRNTGAAILEDGDFTTIVFRYEYEFHGWRQEAVVFTTRLGAVVGYEDDDLVWLPAATNTGGNSTSRGA